MRKLFLLLIIFLTAISAQAQSQVTNTNDSGPGSLRQALLDAAYQPIDYSINFNLPTSSPVFNISSPLPFSDEGIYYSPMPALWFTSTNQLNSLTINATTTSAARSKGVVARDYYSLEIHTVRALAPQGPLSYIWINYTGFSAITYVVTGTDSSNNLDGILREASIRFVGTNDIINFNLTGPAPHHIVQKSAYRILGKILIDGTSQPANGYTGTAPKIELTGVSLEIADTGEGFPNATGITGIAFNGAGYYNYILKIYGRATIGNAIAQGLGNAFYNCPGSAVIIGSSNINTTEDIVNNTFGINPYTNQPAPNNIAIEVNRVGPSVSIFKNVIANCLLSGLSLISTKSISIYDNKIGVLADGISVAPNKYGISVSNSTNVTIGIDATKKNIISGNSSDGISIYGNCQGLSIKANYIGTDATGSIDLGNGGNGINNAGITNSGTIIESNTIAFNAVGINDLSKILMRSNLIYNNDIGIQAPFITAPIITTRTTTQIAGSSFYGGIVQLFEDNEANSSVQGKIFIAEVTTDASGNWVYNGTIDHPCQITAICRSSTASSGFSATAKADFLPDSLTYCIGTNVTLDASNAFASYAWSDGSTSQTLTVSTTGKYWVDVTGCNNFSDTVYVEFINKPTVNLGNDTTICTTQSLILNATVNRNANYVWKYGSLIQTNTTSTMAVTNAGPYSVDVSVGNCKGSDAIVVQRVTLPLAKFGQDTLICNTSTITKNISSVSGVQYNWSDGSHGNSLSISSAGLYWGEARVNDGCFSRDTVNVQTSDCSLLSGIVYNDINNNTILDPADLLLKDYIVSATTSNGTTYYSSTLSDGRYSFNLPNGNYTIAIGSKRLIVVFPTAKQYTVTVNANVLNQQSYDFGLRQPIIDLGITMTGNSIVRIGRSFTTTVQIVNNGQSPQNASFILYSNPFLVLESSSIPYTHSSNYYVFNPGLLNAGASTTVTITWHVPNIASLIGQSFTLDAYLQLSNDSYVQDNFASFFVNTIYAYDPNEIRVAAQYDHATQQAYDTDLLQYDIQFQNTGTDYAEDIEIIDTIPAEVDPSTVRIVGASHNYTWNISGQGIFTFRFDNIMLLDSNTNEPESHGYISYQVNHKNLSVGTEIDNAAYIYFDLNVAVKTNTAVYRITGPPNAQNISMTAVADTIYNDTPFIVLDATSSSGLPISYAYEGPVTMGHDTLYLSTTTGDVLVGAYQNGDANFNIAYPKYTRFVISTRKQTLSFNTLPDHIATDAPFNISATGGASGEPVLFTILSGPATINNNEVTLIGSGTVVVQATQAGNTYYSSALAVTQQFNVTKATQSITTSVIDTKLTSDLPFDLTFTGGISGNTVVYTVVSGPATISGNTISLTGMPGTVIIEATQAGDNFYADAPTVQVSFEVMMVTAVLSGRNDLSAWPNPCTTTLNVSLTQSGNYELINIQGKVVMTGTSQGTLLDVSSLPAGMYTLKINTGDQVKTTAIIKQ